MRNLINKELLIKVETFQQTSEAVVKIKSEIKTTYFDQIAAILKNPPAGGYSNDRDFDRLRVKLALVGKLEGAPSESTAVIEEKDYDEIMLSYQTWSWNITSAEILAFHDYLKGLTKTEPKK